MTRYATSSVWMNSLGDLLKLQGLDVPSLFARAGIVIPASSDTNVRIATEQVSLLWDLVVESSGEPGIALKIAPRRPLPNFDALGYAMLSSPSLLSGLERFERYLSIVSSAAEAHLKFVENKIRLEFELIGGSRKVPRQRYEFDLLCILEFFRWTMDSDLNPVVVELAQAKPKNPEQYEVAFRCPVHFNAKSYCILFDKELASLPVPTSNPRLSNLHDHFLEKCLDLLDSAQDTRRVRELVVQFLPEGEPSRSRIAHLLSMSDRTLQRRLHTEGTSYYQIVDDVRRELAGNYIHQLRIELVEIACLLGFTSQSSFSRAFKRWFNVSPRHYRVTNRSVTTELSLFFQTPDSK